MDSPTLYFVLLAAVLGIGAAVRGTPLQPYWRRFLLTFAGVFLLLQVTNCVIHPTSWCPSPMHIEKADNQWGMVCVR